MTETEDPIGFAMKRWFALMGIPEPTEGQYQTFMVYNLAIPDVITRAAYDGYVGQMLQMGRLAFHSGSEEARIWFYIALFKAASYEIDADIEGVLKAYFPGVLESFAFDHALGFDPALMAKAHERLDMFVMH